MKWPEIKEIATRLRNNPTQSEVALWKVVRNRQLMRRKFLRQHPLIYDADRRENEFFFFIPDFYCSSEKLVIELDGPIHDFQKEKDYKRDLILAGQNIRTLRIQNFELNDMEAVKEKILQMFDYPPQPRLENREGVDSTKYENSYNGEIFLEHPPPEFRGR